MGLAAMIIGIVAVILGFIPLCGMIALIPAIVGLILGVLDVAKKSKAQQPKGQGLAGIILNAVAIIIILVWTLIFAAAAPTAVEQFEEAVREANAAAVEPAER